MLHFHSPDVMRFFGRKPHPNFTGEVTSSYKKRIEGVRVKHYLKGNSLKMYDKAGCVLRIETTLGNVSDFKVLRPTNDTDPDAKLTWNKMRKGVADLARPQRKRPRCPWSLVLGPWSLVLSPWSLVLGPWSLVLSP